MKPAPLVAFVALPVAALLAAAPGVLQARDGQGRTTPLQNTSPVMPALPSGFHQPRPDLLTGGQPAPGDWPGFAGKGVRTVVNLRTTDEMGGRDEAAEVRAAGMDYLQIPVAGAADLTPANADALWTALHARPGMALVHCASGNRVGALLALGAARHGMAPQEALEFGRAGGLAGAEPKVRELLGLPPAVSAPGSR